MENDKFVINGVRDRLEDLVKLPPELAPYKAAEKSNNQFIAFQGELSPISNFHRSPFQLDDMFHQCRAIDPVPKKQIIQ